MDANVPHLSTSEREEMGSNGCYPGNPNQFELLIWNMNEGSGNKKGHVTRRRGRRSRGKTEEQGRGQEQFDDGQVAILYTQYSCRVVVHRGQEIN